MVELDAEGRAVVMGLGRFGGGSGAAAYLLSRGMRVTVTDLAEEARLKDSIDHLRQLGPDDGQLTFKLGGHEESDFTNAQLVVVNPAVPNPWSNRYLQAAQAASVPVMTEIELALLKVPHDKIIGVTGTAGKSTTCAMVHHVLQAQGRRCLLGGNIGGSLLELPEEELDETEAVVIELSSFMLHWIKSGTTSFKPAVGVLTTLDANHLDWHGTMAHYLESKRYLKECVVPGSFIGPLYDEDISGTAAATIEDHWWTRGRDDPWSTEDARERLHDSISIPLPGEHQKRNAMAALRAAATWLAHDPLERQELAIALAPSLASFQGLPHRLRLVGVMRGVQVFDDSKSTTPAATSRAVQAFEDPSRIHLVAGGFDKGTDLAELRALGDTLGGLYTVGETGPDLSAGRNASECGTVDAAVALASARMKEGDILLLSPGCASWDQFDNYEERGESFTNSARHHLEDPGTTC